MLQNGGQNVKWPTSAPAGYITPAEQPYVYLGSIEDAASQGDGRVWVLPVGAGARVATTSERATMKCACLLAHQQASPTWQQRNGWGKRGLHKRGLRGEAARVRRALSKLRSKN